MTAIFISVFSSLIALAAVVFVTRTQIETAQNDAVIDGVQFKIKPTTLSIALLLVTLPMLLFLSFLILILALSEPFSFSGVWLIAVAVGFCWIAGYSLYTVFIVQLKFNDHTLWYRGVFRSFMINWDEVKAINETRLLGLRAKTTRGPLLIWAWSRGVGKLLELARHKGIEIKSTVPLSVTRT